MLNSLRKIIGKIKCKLNKHSFPENANFETSLPCDKWDDCDIHSHCIRLFYRDCKRKCGFTQVTRREANGRTKVLVNRVVQESGSQ